ncbi:hypothetical protein CI109_107209 [Kwoniella shandongensis]|uniref:Cytochrome c oxidase assembly factor 3 n=1 Tax=Kwoniella shandongensis TaxID=1734106 RepID=A0A5M6C332_9TREE|nr:uncharacterized protein CI109_002492 [Kwoniella shandongensis]KAA5529151.1 hypothetical protein CI109_002492 [Kwoniella shandongensis]
MSHTPPTPKAINLSYHPKGYGMSTSLKRARKPFILTNSLIGGTIFAFAVGVYFYSISAVQQDDFSDVEDLLPPLEERSKLRSIEDEAREQKSLQSIASALPLSSNRPLPSATSSPASPSKALPPVDTSSVSEAIREAVPSGRSGWGFGTKRLSEVDWVKKRGWVDGKGNVLVWGAPDVDRLGRVEGGAKGQRLV